MNLLDVDGVAGQIGVKIKIFLVAVQLGRLRFKRELLGEGADCRIVFKRRRKIFAVNLNHDGMFHLSRLLDFYGRRLRIFPATD